MKVYYNKRIEGVNISGIIHNSQYFFSRLSVYENGIINCWHATDLAHFNEMLQNGWVVTQIPVGKSISIYEVGAFEVEDAKWYFDKTSFYDYVKSVVKELNPELKNIYEMTKTEKEKWEKYRVRLMAEETPFRIETKFGYQTMDGDSKYTLYRKDDKLWVTELAVFKNKLFKIDMEEEKMFSLEDIISMIENDILYSYPKNNELLYIKNLGEIKGSLLSEEIAKKEKIKEITEWCKKTAGEEDAIDICQKAYFEYLKYPSEFTRERLRHCYEAVPKHERMFLGDMDSKDGDFIRIIYYPERKREV